VTLEEPDNPEGGDHDYPPPHSDESRIFTD